MNDLHSYDTEMRKSMLDKMFFLEHIDADVYIDYGCADGTLFELMSHIDPSKTYIGFDLDPLQVELAQAKNISNATFFSEWKGVQWFLDHRKDTVKVAIICNSIIHEVYSYGNEDTIQTFWDRILQNRVDYICVRDMQLEFSAGYLTPPYMLDQVRRKCDLKQLFEFEKIWGSVSKLHNLVHFLMKYRYTKNWDREVKENYFSYDRNDLFVGLGDDYSMKLFERFKVPFIIDKIEQDFGFVLPQNTHYKMILERI